MWLTRNSAPVRAIRAAIGCLALIVVALDAIASEDISAAVSEFKNLINTKGSVTMYRQLQDNLLKELIVESGGPQPSAFTRRASN